MAYQAGVVGGSGYTGAELLRLLAGHPDIDVVHVTAASNAGARRSARSTRRSAPRTRASSTCRSTRSPSAGSTSCSSRCRTASPSSSRRSSSTRSPHLVDLGADFRLPAADYAAVVRRRARRARAARPLRVRAARAVTATRSPSTRTSRRPVATRPPRRSRSRRWSPRAWSSRPGSSSTRCRASPAPAAALKHTSHFSEVDESVERVRRADPPPHRGDGARAEPRRRRRRAGAVHAAPRPDGARASTPPATPGPRSTA